VYEPEPPVGVEPVIDAASPLPQNVVVAGAVNVLFANVDGVIVIVTELLSFGEQEPVVTNLL
jgi:hypothetical protein